MLCEVPKAKLQANDVDPEEVRSNIYFSLEANRRHNLELEIARRRALRQCKFYYIVDGVASSTAPCWKHW